MIFHDKATDALPTFALEPNIVQRINFDWTTGICKNGFDGCIQEAHLAWLNHESCQFNLICPILQGDICSLAGLELSYKNQNSSICLENWTYQKQLSTHDVLVLTFWDTSLASFDLNCFAWCSTKSGEIQKALKGCT